MSSSFDKVVKLACKPKAAPPKPKYLDPIIAATWSEDGSVHDVCKALTPRLREPNAIVVFKALIVLHTMIRNGATDNVLSYLSSSSDVLRLRNISTGHWEGYNAPQNLQNYATYLDARIRAYRDLKHDAIRVQSETNRDMRNSAAIDEDRQQHEQERRGRFSRKKGRDSDEGGNSSSLGPSRSKTIIGRKLRVMTVEKGLLRETKIVQKMIDSLVETRFYLDDLEDDLNTTALRMLVKDLLILFQACNEGVINVLEHYFEMSKIDAQEALNIYRHFCKETERVVEYLGVAKKLQNLLNVPIPNLRHAPVSLAGSLEEYLNDPNFEQNRIEYKTNKEIADRNARNGVKPSSKPTEKPQEETKADMSNAQAAPSSSSEPTKPRAIIDFFTAIEDEQQSMFNPQTNSPTSNYFQQQAAHNPFAPRQYAPTQPFAVPQIVTQPTGFIVPQQTAANPFGMQQPQQPPTFVGGLQPQATGFLMPQATGANPFRQSMLFPQSTGAPNMTYGQQPQPQIQMQIPAQTGATNPFPTAGGPFGVQQPPGNTNPFPALPQAQSTNPFPNFASGSLAFSNSLPAQSFQPNVLGASNPFPSFNSAQQPVASPFAQQAAASAPSNVPPRSASVPLSGGGPSEPTPLKTHQTGSRNPFGVPVAPAPPVPKAPTMMEIALGKSYPQPPQQANGAPSPTALKPSMTGFGGAGGANGSLFASVASEFSMPSNNASGGAANTNSFSFSASPTASGSSAPTSLFSSLSSQPTGTASPISPLQPQSTGFGGLKAFKPSSSFGAALLESLPPIPQSAPTTPNIDASKPPAAATNGSSLNSQPTSAMNGRSFLASQPTGFAGAGGPGSTVGVGLRPQTTGLAGAANPFRATMFSTAPGPTGNAFGGTGGLNAAPTGGAFAVGFGGLGTGQAGGPFGGGATSPFGGPFGASASAPTSFNQQQQQPNGQASLI